MIRFRPELYSTPKALLDKADKLSSNVDMLVGRFGKSFERDPVVASRMDIEDVVLRFRYGVDKAREELTLKNAAKAPSARDFKL